ncbi:MAG: hypothetical protein HQ594_06890 [Candidatus Omnitrophica bacterium]|nr:hypothetical protein [Candidatus Omnitrophota bacterium]
MGNGPELKGKINKIYSLLNDHFGDLKWWPAESDFEVMIGAILTQNTSWKNVEKAIDVLKRKKALSPSKIANMDKGRLARYIRSSGYHRLKADRLKEISLFITRECGGKLDKLKKEGLENLREKLLEVKGVGPETADSILVYALGKPVFVVDAYTRRIFSRHGLIGHDAAYDEIQSFVHKNFPRSIRKLNQFHALLVEAAKNFCKKKDPLCRECPLGGLRRRDGFI